LGGVRIENHPHVLNDGGRRGRLLFRLLDQP
jgi:hypothetical protein